MLLAITYIYILSHIVSAASTNPIIALLFFVLHPTLKKGLSITFKSHTRIAAISSINTNMIPIYIYILLWRRTREIKSNQNTNMVLMFRYSISIYVLLKFVFGSKKKT